MKSFAIVWRMLILIHCFDSVVSCFTFTLQRGVMLSLFIHSMNSSRPVATGKLIVARLQVPSGILLTPPPPPPSPPPPTPLVFTPPARLTAWRAPCLRRASS